MLLKTLFKIVFKWFFRLLASLEGTLDTPPSNGRRSSYGAPAEQRAEAAAERALHRVKHAVSDFEESLNRKAESLYSDNDIKGQDFFGQDTADINDLRAELAELKADIRSLKRAVVTNGESNGNPDNH